MVPRSKKEKLGARGWRFGTVQDCLGLSDEEAAYVELRLRLADSLRQSLEKRNLSQTDLAKPLHSNRDLARTISGAPLPQAS